MLWLFSIQMYANTVSWGSHLHSKDVEVSAVRAVWALEATHSLSEGSETCINHWERCTDNWPSSPGLQFEEMETAVIEGDTKVFVSRKGFVAMRECRSTLEGWQTLQHSQHQDPI